MRSPRVPASSFVRTNRAWSANAREGSLSDEEAFVERLWLVHDYRKFTYVDPGLPSTLLPAHWPGTTAAALFREYYAAIDSKSLRFFTEATGQAVTA